MSSYVVLTHHDESIYVIGKKPEGEQYRQLKPSQRYVSRNAERIRNERRDPRLYKTKGTMGPAHVELPDPAHYLKKNTLKLPMLPPELANPDYGRHVAFKSTKPLVPPTAAVVKEQGGKLVHGHQNFIAKNIKDALNAQSKKPERRTVIDRVGTNRRLSAGLEHVHIYGAGYGKIPRYLEEINKERRQHEEDAKDWSLKVEPICRYVARDEREALLNGLKENWEEMQCIYQGLPLQTDTIPKINRKSQLESDLKQLEKDIVLLERHPFIYVYPDDEL